MKYKAVYHINGLKRRDKKIEIGEALLQVYNEAADWLNEVGIDAFNESWDIKHSVTDDYIYGDDYNEAFLDYTKAIHDALCMSKGLDYLLDRDKPVIITDMDYIIVSGYMMWG